MQAEVDVDGGACCLVVKGVHAQDILQIQQVNVGAQRHLPHAVGVEVKLVVRDFYKMLWADRWTWEG